MLTIIETDQEGSASETEEGLGTIQEAEEYGQFTKLYPLYTVQEYLLKQYCINCKLYLIKHVITQLFSVHAYIHDI